MSEIFIDGFDKYSNATEAQYVWTVDGTWSFQTTGGRFGGGAFEATSLFTSFTKDLPTHFIFDGVTSFSVGFSFKASSSVPAAGNQTLLQFGMTAATYTTVLAGTSGQHLAYFAKPDNGGNIGTQGTATVLDGNWHWIECQWLFSTASTGSFLAYVDGVLDLSVTNAITIPSGGNTSLNTIIFTPAWATGNSVHDAFLDDPHVWSSAGTTMNSFPIGPARIYTNAPISNGSTIQYTPSTGTNFSCVNQGFSSTTFISDSSTGKVDLYNFSNLAANPATINTVAINYYGENAGSGTSNLIPMVKTGGTTFSAPTQTLPVLTKTNLQGFFGKDAALATWTAATVNSSQYGQGD